MTTLPKTHTTAPFTKTENRFLDHLIKNPLATAQLAVFGYHILRQTYGWHLESIDYRIGIDGINDYPDMPSYSHQELSRSIRAIARKSILIIEHNQIRINLNIDLWNSIRRGVC